MVYAIIRAILWLAPQLSPATAATYADLIVFEAKWYNINPFLVPAIITPESGWNPRKRSRTNDYGLMQVHVARRGSSNFYGREKELYDPRTNIREGVRIAAMWKGYHHAWCKGEHPWWAHYKWGRVVKDTTHAQKVDKLYQFLKKKFGPRTKERKVAWEEAGKDASLVSTTLASP